MSIYKCCGFTVSELQCKTAEMTSGCISAWSTLLYGNILVACFAFQHICCSQCWAAAGLFVCIRWLDTGIKSSERSYGSNEGSGTWGQLGSCRLTADSKNVNHMCTTDTRGMHSRFGLLRHRIVCDRTIPVARSPMCGSHTPSGLSRRVCPRF